MVIAVAVLSLNACKGESAVAPTPGISLSLSGANQQDTYTMQDHLGNDLIISRKVEAVVENVGPDEMRLKVTTEASGGNGTQTTMKSRVSATDGVGIWSPGWVQALNSAVTSTVVPWCPTHLEIYGGHEASNVNATMPRKEWTGTNDC